MEILHSMVILLLIILLIVIGSKVIYKDNIAIIEGNFTLKSSGPTTVQIDLPKDFTYENCSLISFGSKINENSGYSYDVGSNDALSLYNGALPKLIVINEQNKIDINVYNSMSNSATYYYKIVLFKE